MSAEPGELQRTLGRNLRAWRHARGWSQDIFAEVLGVSRTHLSAIERGQQNVRIGTVERMAQRLGVPLADLLTE